MRHRRRSPGGDNVRGYVSNERGRTNGKDAQSAASGKTTSMKRKPREHAAAYLKPEEIRPDAAAIDVDSRGRVRMVIYKRES